MLLMSDLLTSALRGDDDSYLCGYPLRSTGRYALARTWLAQELPRPGCVWTHSLVVDDETIASSAMWEVMRLHRRPTGLDTSGYRDRAQISQNNESAATESGRSTPLYSIDRARRVVRALYGTAGRQVAVPATDGSADSWPDEALALAVWQQMLPRLRQGFFFCTRTAGGLEDLDFDVVLRFDIDSSLDSSEVAGDIAPSIGLERLALDLCGHTPRSLRAFLVEYESDIPAARVATWVLASIYSEIVEGREGWLNDVAKIIGTELADRSAGAALKSDLLMGRVKHLGANRKRVSVRDRILAFIDLKLFVDVSDVGALVQGAEPRELASIMLKASSSARGTVGASVFSVAAEKLPVDVLSRIPASVDAKYSNGRETAGAGRSRRLLASERGGEVVAPEKDRPPPARST